MNRHYADAPLAAVSPGATAADSGHLLLRLIRSALIASVEHLLLWHERAAQRQQLLTMDHHMLKDIGLTRADVEAEADKPFWRL